MTEEELKEHIRMWIPHVEMLAENYRYAAQEKEIHPIHKDLLDDMKECLDG